MARTIRRRYLPLRFLLRMSKLRRDQMISEGLVFEALSFMAIASGPNFLLFFLVLATMLHCFAMMLPVYGDKSRRLLVVERFAASGGAKNMWDLRVSFSLFLAFGSVQYRYDLRYRLEFGPGTRINI
ncbi:hypothetical protein SLE2022_149010 [Rubroshorea leprosula]